MMCCKEEIQGKQPDTKAILSSGLSITQLLYISMLNLLYCPKYKDTTNWNLDSYNAMMEYFSELEGQPEELPQIGTTE